MNGFKDMLVYLRKRENLTQEELAKALKIGRSTLGMYETGKREPDFETLEAIADFFNVNMSTLIGEGEAEHPASQLSAAEQDALDLIRSLPEEKVQAVLALLRTMQRF